ncbi:MAG: hydroxymethylpyrimidine/phosphomethylpyrimidine kinase, partial [Hymenobacter sp.]
RHELAAPRLPHGEKHGSGCVLSAAIAGQLALGQPLAMACQLAKAYTTRVLASNDTLLGYHY